ncbi:glgB1 [Symbiodinium sp. CCMP2592]|nr:glgB1 [Symbiodinium sp. CCMP2592]
MQERPLRRSPVPFEVPAAVHNGRAFMKEGAEGGGGDAFQQAGGRLPYPDPEEVATNEFAWRRAALGLVLMFTCPGVPMLLQGQEVGDCQPYCWPNGPALDWDRAMETSGIPAAWKMLCQDLIALRVGRSGIPSASPLQGDGIHIFHDQGGVLAYLRWHEAEESRNKKTCGVRLALVVLNFRNHNFGHYTIGVPPSRIWHIAASTPRLENIPDDIQVTQRCPTHGFPNCLEALCEDIIRKSISIDNVVQIMMTAKAHRADGLKDICMASVQDFIITNEEKIKPTPAFKELIQEPTLMYELLMRCCTRVSPPLHRTLDFPDLQGAMLQYGRCLFELLQLAARSHEGTPVVGNSRMRSAAVMTRYSP